MILEVPGPPEGVSERSRGPLGDVLGSLGASWAVFGASWAVLGAPWRLSGAPCAVLGAFQRVLEAYRGIMGPPRGRFGAESVGMHENIQKPEENWYCEVRPGDVPEASWGLLGRFGAFGGFKGRLGPFWERPGVSWKPRGGRPAAS